MRTNPSDNTKALSADWHHLARHHTDRATQTIHAGPRSTGNHSPVLTSTKTRPWHGGCTPS